MTILYLMAAPAEYGPYLRARIEPIMTGIGPVEAAVAATKALAEASAQGRLPDLVVSLGSAGSRSLVQCEVYQAISVSYRDMDASALGFLKGQTPLSDLPIELPLQLRVPGLKTARLSTGANVVSGTAYDEIDADMVDMESFAILRACQTFNVPLLVIRGISDGDRELGHIDGWTQYLHIIDEKLAAAIETIEAAMAAGTLLG